MKQRKLVCGVGINDADYLVKIDKTVGYTEEGKAIRKCVWFCPFYQKWSDMLKRCYSERIQNKYPTYRGCSVTEEWLKFMTFREWMVEQDWEGNCLDKDLLFKGNKLYSPETCIFVPAIVNRFLTECTSVRGEWPIGVYFHKLTGKFKAQCQEFQTRKNISLGLFNDPESAHKEWLKFKKKQAKLLADQQKDPRVAKALIDRYENYGD